MIEDGDNVYLCVSRPFLGNIIRRLPKSGTTVWDVAYGGGELLAQDKL
jgi:hypothetical protein